MSQPLAQILRPKTLDDVIGQSHLVGKVGILRKFLTTGFLPSMIFWGPPGVGKTTLAELVATITDAHFESHSAVTSTLADVRRIIKESEERLSHGKKTVFFLDEIHRFTKSQQDALLPHVEKGTVTFIGATTENPSFEVIAPLLSRCRVVVVTPLSTDELDMLIDRGVSYLKMRIDEDAKSFLKEVANGDGRSLYNILEIASQFAQKKKITAINIEDAAQRKMLQYDQSGEEHYNTISAFIKSMRASQVDAALYYLARMVAAGEDPLFIARRMVIFASEDIGVAQPTALVVANAVFDACSKIGYPEAQINLAHGVVYLCTAKKDRGTYDAYFAALSDVKQYGNLPIPLMVRNAPTKLMKDLAYGKGYDMYATDSFLPDVLKKKTYYPKKT